MSLIQLVPMPDPKAVNGNASPCPTSYLIRMYGLPSKTLTKDCSEVTAAFWKQRLVRENVGPFNVTGHRKAVELLRGSLAKVKEKHPDLYKALGSAGMLCNRHVRGNSKVLSNHGLGLAIDFTIGGILDPRGDKKVQRGLITLYSVMKQDGWFWGVEFGIEDAMHFEVSNEVVRQWIRDGVF